MINNGEKHQNCFLDCRKLILSLIWFWPVSCCRLNLSGNRVDFWALEGRNVINKRINKGASFCVRLCVCMSPCIVSVCWWEKPIRSAILQTHCFTQGGLFKLRHYITRGVMSCPKLSQWTIPLPEFMFCPEEETGEAKQTSGEVYRFWGESITKQRVKYFTRNIVLEFGQGSVYGDEYLEWKPWKDQQKKRQHHIYADVNI